MQKREKDVLLFQRLIFVTAHYFTCIGWEVIFSAVAERMHEICPRSNINPQLLIVGNAAPNWGAFRLQR